MFFRPIFSDLWMLGGFMFLFLTLAELAVISHVIRSDRPRRDRKLRPRPVLQNGYCDPTTAQRLASPNMHTASLRKPSRDGDAPFHASRDACRACNGRGRRWTEDRKLFGRWTPCQIDYMCLLGFTPLFVIYNFMYWSLCYYSSAEDRG